MPEVASEEVANYQDLVSSIARRYSRKPGCEMDDLIQEGLIDVWLALKKGRHPSAKLIARRMKRWTEKMARQRGLHVQ